MKYKIVEGYLNPFGKDVKDIEKSIQGRLDAGFKLYGNLIHIKNNKYTQAMVYEELKDN